MVIVLVRTARRKDSDDAEYAAAGKRMVELASAMPGFVSYENLGHGGVPGSPHGILRRPAQHRALVALTALAHLRPGSERGETLVACGGLT